MTQNNAAQLFQAIKEDQILKQRLKAATDVETFIQIASECGYEFTLTELQTELSKISSEELAAIINPGVAPRLHIVPR
ncbi:Nif11-like leader peptide family natural product precursor [Calothrix sp. 336/3]|uniref:Nif11-like leader peptide family natural product precursor n=1 Tax=Calothrix sp. 336/3 TaxID=1337936 RepID=UPI0004E3F826|nr:Nif11-like leader peptide family natural product precursor [Calothrix sp. 336/3]AKG23028.1 bacteriocin [Calothrix sp. 336/3]